MSAIEKLQERVAVLEAEVAKLKKENGEKHEDSRPCWEKIYGTFEGDPHFKEAVELGRKYRDIPAEASEEETEAAEKW